MEKRLMLGNLEFNWSLHLTGTLGGTLIASNEEAEFKLMIDVASKVLNGFGYAEKSDELFFITLEGAYLIAGKKKIFFFFFCKY